jgi:hypothetical protein
MRASAAGAGSFSVLPWLFQGAPPTSSDIAPVVQIFGLNTGIYLKALDGLDEEAARRQVLPQTNPLLWIAGHLATTRFGIATMAGRERPLPWGKIFHRSAVLDVAALPPLARVREAWQEISDLVVPRLYELTSAELAALAPRPFPIEDKSLRGAITFLSYHEGYHIGQMSYIRRSLGLSGLVG